MSEESINGCIQHRDTRHLRLYYDYMDIYGNNEYKAKIIRILETWTDHKRAEWYKTNSDRLEQGQEVLEPDFWITMSYQQFRQSMRHTASEDTLKKALTELEQAKHITRRINPDFPYGPPQYVLNIRLIQAALNKLLTPPFIPVIPPQEDTPPLGKSIPPQEITPTQGVEIPPPRGEKTREGGRKNTPTQGGKFGTSNITTKNHLEDVIDSHKEEREGEQEGTSPIASSLSLDTAPSPQSEFDTHSQQQQGDTHGSILPAGHTDLHRPLERTTASGTTQDALGDTNRTATPQQQREIDPDFCNAETEHRLPAVSKPVPPSRPASPDENRDAPLAGRVAATGPGATPSVPVPPALPGSPPPVSEVHVLIVAQQFTSIEQWKEAQDSFIETLRGVWKQAGPDFKQQYGNWNGYRKQYLERWLRANHQPTEESLLAPEARRIWQDWQTNYKRPIPLTASDKQALVMLLPSQPTREELKMCRGWLFSTDDPNRPWYRKIGVSLLDCAKNWGKWQSLQDIPTSASSNPHGTVSGLPHLEPSQEWLEAMGGR